MKYFFVLIALAILSSCNSGKRRTNDTIREIEQAYQKGEITKKEYIQFRIDAERAYQSGTSD